jgi:hypothetical protein
MSLKIARGVSIADMVPMVASDPTTSPKLSPARVARLQARSGLAWTWRRPDGKAVVCAGLYPLAGRLSDLRSFEAWFSCSRDLSRAELYDFLRFAQLTLLCVAHDGPHETFAYVKAGRSTGARIARLIGFAFDQNKAGLDRWRWTSGGGGDG